MRALMGNSVLARSGQVTMRRLRGLLRTLIRCNAGDPAAYMPDLSKEAVLVTGGP